MIGQVASKCISVAKQMHTERQQGGNKKVLRYLHDRLSHYLVQLAWFLVTCPFALIIIGLRPLIKIHLVLLQTSRIGHFTASTELNIIREGTRRVSNRELTLFYPEPLISNKQIFLMYKRVLPIIRLPKLCHQIDKTLIRLLGDVYLKHWSKTHATGSLGVGRDVDGLLAVRSVPSITFTRQETRLAEQALRSLGIPYGQKFVCLLVRDANYLKTAVGNGIDHWQHHGVRDSVVANYKKAALYLAEKGYTVLRMGKHVQSPFDVNHPNVIDYANHPVQSDLLDVYLTAHCHFMISTSTGLDCVAQIFRRPILFVDVFPLLGQLQYWYPCTLFIPKKLYQDGKMICFKDMEKHYTDLSSMSPQETLSQENVTVEMCTEDEILAAAEEMEARIEQTWIETDEALRLQRKFLDTCPITLIPEKQTLPNEAITIKLGSAFSKRYPMLLEQ